jgi:hypothetical protein
VLALEVALEVVFESAGSGATTGVEVFLKWVDGETPRSLKKKEKYGFIGAVALYF